MALGPVTRCHRTQRKSCGSLLRPQALDKMRGYSTEGPPERRGSICESEISHSSYLFTLIYCHTAFKLFLKIAENHAEISMCTIVKGVQPAELK